MTNQAQLNTANRLLAQDLSRLSFDRIVELCLIKKASPTALPSFIQSLRAEIARRYTDQELSRRPTEYAVLQNFANQLADPVGEFELVLRQMQGQINKDIWFTNNRDYFVRIASDRIGIDFLIAHQEILQSCLSNPVALPLLLSSTRAIESIVTNSTAYEKLWSADWGQIARSTQTMAVLIKSREITTRMCGDARARNTIVTQSVAMNAIVGNATARGIVVGHRDMMNAIVGNATARGIVVGHAETWQAVAASQVAMTLVVSSSSAKDTIIASNANFQAARATLYEMVKANWTKQAHQSQDNVTAANNAMAQKAGLVFACLGYYNHGGSTSMLHKNGTLAAEARTHQRPNSMLSVDAVSFDGARFTEEGDGHVYCELWVPRV